MKTLNRTIVSAMLMSSDDKILLGRVRAGGVYPDCWHIPGGGVDEGETKQQTLIREIMEEVGLDISSYPTKLVRDVDTGEAIKTDKDKERFERVAKQIEAGMASQNNASYLKPYNPFGGYKQSGLGREHGKYGFHDVTQVKVITTEK